MFLLYCFLILILTILLFSFFQNADLLAEARRAKSYRDEVDAMKEKADRADKLEAEAQRYRERLADAEFYKVRVDELREDNRVLIETREMLEGQLARARQRSDHMLDLEAELISCKQKINEIALVSEANFLSHYAFFTVHYLILYYINLYFFTLLYITLYYLVLL